MTDDSIHIKYRFLSGGISGIIEVICTHPIDLIKTRLQEASQNQKEIKYPIRYFYNKYRVQGLPYIYTGFVPRILGIVPMRLVFWGVQGNTNEYLKKYNISDARRLILAGVIAGSAQTIIDNPIETIKIRLITSNTSSISKNIFFSGFGPTLARNSLFAAIFNYTAHILHSENYTIQFFSAAFGGFIASIVTQPLDYIKTEKQRLGIKERSIINIIRNDYRSLMIGIKPRAILGFFNMGIGMTVYNFMTKQFI